MLNCRTVQRGSCVRSWLLTEPALQQDPPGQFTRRATAQTLLARQGSQSSRARRCSVRGSMLLSYACACLTSLTCCCGAIQVAVCAATAAGLLPCPARLVAPSPAARRPSPSRQLPQRSRLRAGGHTACCPLPALCNTALVTLAARTRRSADGARLCTLASWGRPILSSTSQAAGAPQCRQRASRHTWQAGHGQPGVARCILLSSGSVAAAAWLAERR